MRFGVSDHFGAAGKFFAEAFLAPRRNHFQFRRKRRRRQFETHLVIPLARRAVRHGLGALRTGDFDHALGDERTRNARAEKILTFVKRPCPEHGKNKVPGKFLLQIVDKTLGRAGAQGLLFQTVKLLLLPDIRAEGDNLRIVSFFQPLQQDRGVQTARVSAYNLHQITFLHRSIISGNAATSLQHSVRRATFPLPAMRMSKRGEYALRALIDLGIAAEVGRPLLRAQEIVARENLPKGFLDQILMQLRKAGFIGTKRGKNGGYFLDRPMESITLGQVIRLIDGPLAPIRCVSQSKYEKCSCPDEDTCALRMIMLDVRNSLADILDRHTLADSVRRSIAKMQASGTAWPLSLP